MDIRKRIILDITPETHVRSTQGDRILFRIPRNKLKPASLIRLKRLEKYNDYKANLLALARKKNMSFHEQGMEINFYLPVPKSWSNYKKQKMHMQGHKIRPDLSNILKAAEDALLKEDKYIFHYASLSKKWVNQERGYIEFVYHLPTIASPDLLL
jgi:Holliday junction resolvase RusA-like endonuclease